MSDKYILKLKEGLEEEIEINQVRIESSGSIPICTGTIVYTADGLTLKYFVKNEYIRCVNKSHMSDVYRDSCVEFFCSPDINKGYINFEFNALGYCLAAFRKSREEIITKFDDNIIGKMKIIQSLKSFEDIKEEVSADWSLEVFIPFNLFEEFFGTTDLTTEWYCNFYKCGDHTKYPHWISWAPVSKLNFHSPSEFGIIKFTGADIEQN